jgi:Putative zinc-finger
MTRSCDRSASGAIELYFYGDIPAADRLETERHLEGCASCQAVLEDLSAIASALGSPVVDAPRGGDWSGFMRRLRHATERERRPSPARWPLSGLVAAAALLALVVPGVIVALRSTRPPAPAAIAEVAPGPAPVSGEESDGFTALSEEHLQRSKLVVLGLAAKDPSHATSADWVYERGLAAALLTDTRMYRMAAEDRGLRPIAEVMRDLEVVLLQTSFTDPRDPKSLGEIQRLIRKRDLVGKMDVVGVSGL